MLCYVINDYSNTQPNATKRTFYSLCDYQHQKHTIPRFHPVKNVIQVKKLSTYNRIKIVQHVQS